MTFLSDATVDFIAGWCSGGAAVVLCQPIDTVLTRYQAGRAAIAGGAVVVETTSSTTIMRPTSIYRSLIHQFGVSSLWRGSMAMISAVPFQNALLMSGYGFGKRYSESMNHSSTHVGVFVGGCTGGVLQSFLMSPVELIKVSQQVHVNKKAVTKNVVTHLFNSSSWRGLNATILRDGLPHGVWFVSYEVSKDWLSTTSNKDELEGHEQVTVPLLSGAIAATVAWAVGYPADLIKTRIQASSSSRKGIYETALELHGEPGGLYRGFTLKLVRSIPASMIGFVTYEFVKNQLTKRGGSK
jgi:solute carrier family 25 carnitine/acylcarnitine transporter 20/29